MALCKFGCTKEIIIKKSTKTGRWYSTNLDGSFHQCPNYNKSKSDDSTYGKLNSDQSNPSVTDTNELVDEKNIENAKWFIDGLNLRLVCKTIELIVKDKDYSN